MQATTLTTGSQTLDANSIAYALARNEAGEKLPLVEVLAALDLTPTTALKNLLSSAGFKNRYAAYLHELKESGESFRLKARVQAEALLPEAWSIIHDRDAPHSVRMQGIENMVQWAELTSKKGGGDAPAAPQITINIDLGGDKPEIIDVTPAKEITDGDRA